jgi:ACR3 family arsenite transporter
VRLHLDEHSRNGHNNEHWGAQQGVELVSAAGVVMTELDPSPNISNAPPRLSLLDRLLTVWIFAAMALGILIGYYSPSSAARINSWTFGSLNVNVPIAVGLILMMWPPLARVKYDEIIALLRQSEVNVQRSGNKPAGDASCHAPGCAAAAIGSEILRENSLGVNAARPSRRLLFHMLLLSLLLNWIVGPFLMFSVAVAALPDHAAYVRGLVYTGLARCIAMVVVWNTLSGGSNEYVAILVALNSMFQILIYSPYAYLFTAGILPHVGIQGSSQSVSFTLILQSVAIYLGIPFVLGFGSWWLLPRATSREWYEKKFLPTLAPLTLIALLFTIVVMFILKGDLNVSIPTDILRICGPLLAYFLIMFFSSFFLAYRMHMPYAESVTLAFTAASNNFELSIAVSVAVFGLDSSEALACVVGPLVEVPAMLALVHVARWAKRFWKT